MTKVLNPEKRYVCGFIFDAPRENVLLIRKKRPDWQAGKLNGIGGEIEDDESSVLAMMRECKEECGLSIQPDSWYLFCSLQDQHGWWIDFFYASFEDIDYSAQITDESLEKVPVSDLTGCMTNLHWLIPMALSMKDETCAGFEIKERRA